MSLSKTITQLVDDVIADYTRKISEKFDIQVSDLEEIWAVLDSKKLAAAKPKAAAAKPAFKQPKIDFEDTHALDHLISMKKPDLQAICRERGLACTGTKDELIKRIVAKNPVTKAPAKAKASAKTTKESPVKAAAKPTATKAGAKPKASALSKSKSTSNLPSVTQKIMSKLPLNQVRKNQFGNIEHPETQLIFDENKTAIGKQNDDGSIDPLTAEDIEICNKFKFKFEIPDNLDGKTNLRDVQVEELEEDEEVIDDDEEQEIAEEELIDDEEEEVEEEDADIEYDE